MKTAIQKPSFREVVGATTMNLDDKGLVFNSQAVGPMNFAGLRQADYGQGFRMPTMPELIPLVYASLENKEYQTAKNVIQTLKQSWLTGNTGILYTLEGMFVQDNPKLEKGRISMDEKILQSKLGRHEEKGVTFSDDRSIRFVPYGFKRESQSSLDLATNPVILGLTGSQENAERLAKSSEHYSLNPYFWALKDVQNPETRVAVMNLGGFDNRLSVGASGSEDGDNRYSFGVFGVSFEDAEGVAPKKE